MSIARCQDIFGKDLYKYADPTSDAGKFAKSVEEFRDLSIHIRVWRGTWGWASRAAAMAPEAPYEEQKARAALWKFLNDENPIKTLKLLKKAEDDEQYIQVGPSNASTCKHSWKRVPEEIKKIAQENEVSLTLREKYLLFAILESSGKYWEKDWLKRYCQDFDRLRNSYTLNSSLGGYLYFWWKGYVL